MRKSEKVLRKFQPTTTKLKVRKQGSLGGAFKVRPYLYRVMGDTSGWPGEGSGTSRECLAVSSGGCMDPMSIMRDAPPRGTVPVAPFEKGRNREREKEREPNQYPGIFL